MLSVISGKNIRDASIQEELPDAPRQGCRRRHQGGEREFVVKCESRPLMSLPPQYTHNPENKQGGGTELKGIVQ